MRGEGKWSSRLDANMTVSNGSFSTSLRGKGFWGTLIVMIFLIHRLVEELYFWTLEF